TTVALAGIEYSGGVTSEGLASIAPGVSSQSGTPPGRSVQAQPPGSAPVYGWRSRYCCFNNQSRIASFVSSASRSPAAARAFTLSVVTHVARFVSIGQLPSGRTDAI